MGSQNPITVLIDEVNEASRFYSTSGVTPTSDETSRHSTGTPRHKLLAAAKALVSALEDPEEEAYRFVLQPCAHACYIAAKKRGILDQWPKATMSSEELAELTKTDRKLVGERIQEVGSVRFRSLPSKVRMMRSLTIYGICNEVEEEIYEHTPLSLKLVTPPLSTGALGWATQGVEGIRCLPGYLSKTSFQNPGDDPDAQTLFQFATNTDLEYFEWLHQHPELHAAFNVRMANSMKTKGFSDTYPFGNLGEGLSSADDVVLVDVGGGYGHALANIQQYVPELKGKKMILEDFAKTIESHVPLENTDAVPYDFLTTEQPIKGARAYLLRHVLHDWSDHVCRKILLHAATAMTKESRILIAEIILPDLNPPVLGALADIVMMKYGGSGRKRKEWIAIFESSGLEVVKIWPPVTIDSIMELKLKSA